MLCRPCKRDIIDQEAVGSGCFIILRKPAEIKASASSGCRACAIFEANLVLFDGFTSRTELYENFIVSRSAREEYLLARYGEGAPDHGDDSIDEEALAEMKRGRVLSKARK
jgi:hypothetical protein